MTTESAIATESRRSTGRKPYPVTPVDDCLELPRVISEHGFEGRLRRLSALERLGRSPSSSASHTLIASAVKYGLISGGRNSEFFELTEDGERVVNGDPDTDREIVSALFDISISKFQIFDAVYGRLKNQRLPAGEVLNDVVEGEGVNRPDCSQVSDVLIKNARFIGLVREQSGGEYIISVEQAIEELALTISVPVEPSPPDQDEETTPRQVVEPEPIGRVVSAPTVHIDLQIHVDANAGPEQIDQIFASMAKHLNV